MGCAGNHEVHTPNMDYLAKLGVRFPNAYTPCPVCSPARASFWTGTMPSWHGVHDHLNDKGHPGIGDQSTLADALQRAGYLTAQIGKWHCHTSEDNRPRPGFDRWFSHRAGTRARFGEQIFWNQEDTFRSHGFQAPMITQRALDFLRVARNAERPFLCAVGYTNTHRPFTDVPERIVSRYADTAFDTIPVEDLPSCHGRATRPMHSDTNPEGQLRTDSPERLKVLQQYFGAVTFIDEQLGILLDELKSLELWDNTLVIYTSDHGFNVGHHGLAGKGNASVPQNFFDESLRIPFIAHLPRVIEGGVINDAAICHTDTYKTLLELARAHETDDAPRPGKPWLPLLDSAPAGNDSWRDEIICEYGNARMIRTDRYKLTLRYPGPNGVFPDELYDLKQDPRETTNIIENEGTAEVVETLTATIAEFFATYSHPSRNGLQVSSLPAANVKEPWRVNR